MTVLAIISVSLTFNLQLGYLKADGKAVTYGEATLTLEIEILMFSVEVSVKCRREFSGGDADPRFIDLVPTPQLWAEYCGAFADEATLMARQSLVWTALPNGFTPDGTGLRVSAMLSPRLDPQAPIGKLGSFFPDWEDWPQTLASARFDVSYNGATVSIPATTLAGPDRVDATVGVADSAVWKALFDATTLVIGFAYRDLSPSVMLSYDTVVMAEAIEHLYGDLARAATDRMPRVTELIETERWRGFINAVRVLDEASVDRHTGLREPRWQFDALRRGSLRTSDTLANFQLFHTPPAASTVRSEKRKDDAPH